MLPERDWEELRQAFYREDSPGLRCRQDLKRVFDLAARFELPELTNKIGSVAGQFARRSAARAWFSSIRRRPVEPVVFVRGATRAGRVSRCRATSCRQSAVTGSASSRRGAAASNWPLAIASPRNPLTARVIVNRVWMHHFGAGIVRTPSDFGIRGTPPSHPELLDYLASHFMQEGWSLKTLHRQILFSAVYQQDSGCGPTSKKKIRKTSCSGG